MPAGFYSSGAMKGDGVAAQRGGGDRFTRFFGMFFSTRTRARSTSAVLTMRKTSIFGALARLSWENLIDTMRKARKARTGGSALYTRRVKRTATVNNARKMRSLRSTRQQRAQDGSRAHRGIGPSLRKTSGFCGDGRCGKGEARRRLRYKPQRNGGRAGKTVYTLERFTQLAAGVRAFRACVRPAWTRPSAPPPAPARNVCVLPA